VRHDRAIGPTHCAQQANTRYVGDQQAAAASGRPNAAIASGSVLAAIALTATRKFPGARNASPLLSTAVDTALLHGRTRRRCVAPEDLILANRTRAGATTPPTSTHRRATTTKFNSFAGCGIPRPIATALRQCGQGKHNGSNEG
jgi:hypothetical protein